MSDIRRMSDADLAAHVAELAEQSAPSLRRRLLPAARLLQQRVGLPLGRHTRAWTDEEDARLRAAWDMGLRTREIADQLRGRSKEAVRQRAQDLQLPKRRSGRWTDEEREAVRVGLLEGLTYHEIGLPLGRSERAVAQEIHRMRRRGDLPPPSSGKGGYHRG